MQLQTTGTIRQRGQLTIPESIREEFDWAAPGSVVIIEPKKTNEILLRPYSPKKKPNWNEIWGGIKRARAIKGKSGNLSVAITQDRQKHF
jgi:AbrB family looped-hinge helix DNA binding protein